MRKPAKPAKRRYNMELPEPLWAQLCERAKAETTSMRQITIEALRAHLAQPREEGAR